jgi:hypothetical protein
MKVGLKRARGPLGSVEGAAAAESWCVCSCKADLGTNHVTVPAGGVGGWRGRGARGGGGGIVVAMTP